MNTIHIKSLLSALFIFAAMSMVQAQPYGPGANGKGYKHAALDLSEAQEKQIEELRTAHAKEMLPLRNTLNEKEARLQTLRTAEKYDKAAVEKVLTEISNIKLQMAKSREAHRQDVRALLTDEQRVKFDMHAGPHHRMGHRGPHGNKGRGFRGDCPNNRKPRQGRNAPDAD